MHIDEGSRQQHRTVDTTTGDSSDSVVAEQTLFIDEQGRRFLVSQTGSIVTVDGTAVPASTLELFYCRTCNNGPFAPAAAFRCACGRYTCKQCAVQYKGSWMCRRTRRWQRLHDWWREFWSIP